MSKNYVSKKDKEKKNIIPSDYIKVELDTVGKLGFPKVIHVRDFRGDDMIKLAVMDESSALATIVEILNNNIYEDVSIEDAHIEDIKEILLNVILNFWTHSLEKVYPITDEEFAELPKEKQINIVNGKDYLMVDIPIKNIKTNPLPDNINNPITIKEEENEYKLRFSRVRDVIITDNYLEDYFYNEKMQFSNLVKDLEFNKSLNSHQDHLQKNIDKVSLDAYNSYLEKRSVLFAKLLNAFLIKEINGAPVGDNINEKLEAYDKIPPRIWRAFNKKLDSIEFGVNDNVEIISPVNQKKVTRRFQFRLLDFLQNLDRENDSEITIDFG